MPSQSQRWVIEVARIYEAVVHLEGRISLTKYFADVTLKKQIAVTALFEYQMIIVDFVLVSVFTLLVTTRLLMRGSGSRCIACITCANPTGGSVLSPPLHGSVPGVSRPVFAGEGRNLIVVISIR